jgi:hypothetical protein
MVRSFLSHFKTEPFFHEAKDLIEQGSEEVIVNFCLERAQYLLKK